MIYNKQIGGIHNEVSLLKLEGTNMKEFFVPKKGTALQKMIGGI